MITRSEVYIKNIQSIGFRYIREGVTLKKLILRSLECALIILMSACDCSKVCSAMTI